MSATLYFSNSPAVLLDKLSENLEWPDPFAPPRIATMTPAMKRWVQLRLADKRGIVANVEFSPLERTLWHRLTELDAEREAPGRKPARLMDEHSLQFLILESLRNDPPPEAREYLRTGIEGGGQAAQALYARRICQLSQKLAGLFREYEYSRVREHGYAGLAYLWKHGEDCFEKYGRGGLDDGARAQAEKLEAWQKSVYHGLFRPGGRRDALGIRSGQYRYTLPQYAEMVLAQNRPPAGTDAKPAAYHFFGLSQISPFHRSLIRSLSDGEALAGRAAVFHLYSLNPCAEYWEDALTPGELRARRRADARKRRRYADWRRLNPEEKLKLKLETEAIQKAELLWLEDDHPLLSQWGRPGRENIQLWNQITDYDFLESFREAPGSGSLAAVQNALLRRRGNLEPEEKVPQDASLQILACPEIHREAETVRENIVDAMLRDPGLRPDDIAVLAPDMEKYRPALSAAFGRAAEGRPGQVPCNFSELHASGESEYARGVKSLLRLARGRFDRLEMLELAGNACFRRARGIGDDAPGTWAYWIGVLNIFHSFDEEDKRARGYAPDPAHSWMHGLRRLALGAVMENPPLDDERHFEGVVPYADALTRDRESLQAFLAAVEDLHRHLAPWRDGGERSWAEWTDTLTRLFDSQLAVADDDPAEALVRTQLRRFVSDLRETAWEAPAEGDSGVSGEVAAEQILAYLDGLQAAGHQPLSGGVNIGSLHSLRSIPFRRIYVLGLGEGEFPDAPDASTLDLRRYRRVIGDADPAMRNRYLLLEALVCASDALCLSYVCRDASEGKTLQPGSALNELTDYLRGCVLAPDAADDDESPEFRCVPVPLLSRSPALFDASAADRPWDTLRNRSREDRIMAWIEKKREAFFDVLDEGFDPDQAAREFAARLRNEAPYRIARDIFPPAPAYADLPPPPAREVMGLEDIGRFLRNPVDYTLRREMKIYERDDDDELETGDEPFFSEFPWKYKLPESAFRARLEDWKRPPPDGSWQAFRPGFDALYENLSRRGEMPEGRFGELDRDRLWETTEKQLTSMEALLSDLRKDPRSFEYLSGVNLGEGDGRSLPAPGGVFPPVILENVAGRTIELHGHLPYFFRPEAGGGCAVVTGVPYDKAKPKQLLPPYLFYAAAALSPTPLGDWMRSGPFTAYQHGKKEPWAVYDFSRTQAETYLRTLLEAVLKGGDMDLLPFEIVVHKPFVEKTLNARYELQAVSDYVGVFREAVKWVGEDEHPIYKPGDAVKILQPEIPADAEAKIRERLGFFFAGIRT